MAHATSVPRRTGQLFRFLRVLAGAVFLIGALATPGQAQSPRWGDITGPVTATSLGIRIPQTLAEVATLTEADRAAIHAAADSRLPQVRALIASGSLTVQTVTGTARASGKQRSIMASHLLVGVNCSIQWTDYPLSGTYMWADGSTTATSAVSLSVQGWFYQDGPQIDNFAQYLTSTRAYNRSGDHWRAWFEPTHHYTLTTEHYIYNPDNSIDYHNYCYVDAYK